MSTTCLACVIGDTCRDPDVAAVGVLAYAWAHKRTLESLCKGLCEHHEGLFRRSIAEAGLPSVSLMFHDDDCGELLDERGRCPRCAFAPDMQSCGFKEVPLASLDRARTYLGLTISPSTLASCKGGTV